MSTVHSYEGRLEIQAGGIAGSGGYIELKFISNPKLNASRTVAKVPKRGSDIRPVKPGQMDLDITGAMTWDDADATVALVEAAFFEKTVLGVKFLDQASGTGLTSDMYVTEFEFSQDEDNIQIVNIKLEPAYVATEPSWA